MTVGQVTLKWQVYMDYVTQYLSRFKSRVVAHCKRHQLCVKLFGLKIADFLFSIMNQSLSTKDFFLFDRNTGVLNHNALIQNVFL